LLLALQLHYVGHAALPAKLFEIFFGPAANSLFAAGCRSDVPERYSNVGSVPSAPVGPQAISVTVTPSSSSVMLGNQFLFARDVADT
jgi:hypothetical protein